VRDYGLGFALSALALWLYPVRDSTRRVSVIAMAVVTAAAILTWYFHAVFLLLQAAFFSFSKRARTKASLGVAVGLLVAAPWLVASLSFLLPQFTGSTHAFTGAPIVPPSPASYAAWVAENVVGLVPQLVADRLVIALLAITTFAGWTVLAIKRAWSGLAIGAGGALLALAVAYVSTTRWAGPGFGNRAVTPAVFFPFATPALALATMNGYRPVGWPGSRCIWRRWSGPTALVSAPFTTPSFLALPRCPRWSNPRTL
jgi:hypothetical protein